MKQLIKVLNAAGKNTHVLTDSSAAAVLVSPYGGRVLGLFVGPDGGNLLWTNPALDHPDSARRFFENSQWHNTGGDRTWLAPEVDFFFPRFPDMNYYVQPRQLDPGNYQVTQNEKTIHMCNELTIQSYRFGHQISLRITKSVSLAPNPLRHEVGLDSCGKVAYAGYTLRTSLDILSAGLPNHAVVGIWQLLQMPHGGELIIPTYSRAEPRMYFGQIPPGDLAVSDHLVKYAMRAPGGQKIGVKASAVTGRAGYIYPQGNDHVLIIRNFFVNPSDEYLDVPWDGLTEYGFAFQACNVNTDIGCFSELEYHCPVGFKQNQQLSCTDISQVWGFRGPLDKIKRIIQVLLGPYK
jgi:hypothetical protein